MRRFSLACLLAIAASTAFVFGAAGAQAATVKEVFEQYNLLGTWAWDCTKPASDNNWYYVNRLIDADHVQRDFMTGPNSRQWLAIIDKAVEIKPNEIMLSGQMTGRISGRTVDQEPSEGVWRIEQSRMQQLSAKQSGKMLIADGKMVSTGKDMPWVNKCDAR